MQTPVRQVRQVRFTHMRRFVVCGLGYAIGLILLSTQVSRGAGAPSEYLNAAPGVAYLGSESCAACHPSIYEAYRRTHMARSMSPAFSDRGRPDIRAAATPAAVFDSSTNLYYQAFRRGSDFYQSVYQRDAAGKETFRHTERMTYAVGSGLNGIGYIVRRGNYVFEAPLAFYVKTGSWNLAPGYRGFDIGFTRPITARCIVCHSGLAQPVPERTGLYLDPPFRELAIGCENCHGPGELHVRARTRGDPAPADGIDRTIVNPARLPTWLANNLCTFCHEDGDAHVLEPGKRFLDYRPGLPLDNTLALFQIPRGLKRDAQPALLDRYAELVSSQCYQASGGKLGCLTCHDPHPPAPPRDSAAYYRGRCLTCHQDASCRLPLSTRLEKSPPDDCAGCHMFKQGVSLPHSSVTNHRIVAWRGEPELVSPGTTALPDLIHLDAIPGAGDAPVSPLMLLDAYRQIALDTHNSAYLARYFAVLDGLQKSEPESVPVLSAKAHRESEDGTPEGARQAILDLTRALALGSIDPGDRLLLADTLTRARREREAIPLLRQGIAVDPYYTPYYESLAAGYISMGDVARASEIITKGLGISPESRLLRRLQERVRKASGAR